MTRLNPGELPAVRIALPYIAGTCFVMVFPEITPTFLLFSTMSVSFIWLFYRLKPFRPKPAARNLTFHLWLIAMGMAIAKFHHVRHITDPLHKAGTDGIFLLKVTDLPVIQEKSVKIPGCILKKKLPEGREVAIDEKVYLYVTKPAPVFNPGMILLIRCRFKSIEKPCNPYQFDYKKYCERQGIKYTASLRPEDLCIAGIDSGFDLNAMAAIGVQWVRKTLHTHIRGKQTAAVAESLLIGYKDEVSKSLVDAYAHTGTLHVLAVSGMHVAIVFLLFEKLLGFLKLFPGGLYLQTTVVIILIWGYCMITGLAPSIIRAGLMITLVLLGKCLNRHANTFNIIAFSALIILILNPYGILNIGFQLSYCAVMGILAIHPKLQKLWNPGFILWRGIRDLISVTVSAQIATLPVSLYYFNQFPNYFLPANLLLIPLTTFIIYCGITLLICSEIDGLAGMVSRITQYGVNLANNLVSYIESLPFATVEGLKIDRVQFVLLCLFIVLLFSGLNPSKTRVRMYALCSILMLLLCIGTLDTLRCRKQKALVIFNVPGKNYILCVNGLHTVLFTDDIPASRSDAYFLKGWCVQNRVWPIEKRFPLALLTEGKSLILPYMDLYTEKGILFFKNFALNVSRQPVQKINIQGSLIMPGLNDGNIKLWANQKETLFIGQGKSKWLQKKLYAKLSFYHKNVKKKPAIKKDMFLIINL